MITKEVLGSFLKMGTPQIVSKLEKGLLEGEKFEAAITVLKKRNVDVSSFEESEKPILPVELQNQVDEAITKIIESEQEDLQFEAGKILDNVPTPELTEKQANQIIELVKKVDQPTPPKKNILDILEKKKSSSNIKPQPLKEKVILSEEKLKKAEEILKLPILKKYKIIKFGQEGFTRSEVLKLKFSDPVYVYDLYRVQFPDLCK